VCTFEKDDSCLLADNSTNKELWTVVDGREIVVDNTLEQVCLLMNT